MKKYIVLSVNDNVDYLYFTPLTCWAWRKLGWEPIVFYQRFEQEPSRHIKSKLAQLEELISVTPSNSEIHKSIKKIQYHFPYRHDTITQISRLYSGCVLDPSYYAMTGDIDMIPLFDYWKPVATQVTVWGHDLTGFGHFPICYIGMSVENWRQVMKLNTCDYNQLIKRDLDTLPQAKDPDFYKYWFCDQDLITQRLKAYGTEKIEFINRGQYSNGYAKGRVDRGAWTLEHEQFIDAHLFQQTHHSDEKIRKTMELLETVWPDEDFQWFRDYTVKFKELAK